MYAKKISVAAPPRNIGGAECGAETLIWLELWAGLGNASDDQKVKRLVPNKTIGECAKRDVYFCQSSGRKNQPSKALTELCWVGILPSWMRPYKELTMGEFLAVLVVKLAVALIESDRITALARHMSDLIVTFIAK